VRDASVAVSGTVGDAGVDSADVSGEDNNAAVGVGIGKGGDNSKDDVVIIAFGGGDSSCSDETGGMSEDLEVVDEGSVDDEDADVDVDDELSECRLEGSSLPERSIVALVLAPCIHKGFFIHLRGVSVSGEVTLLVAVCLPRNVREWGVDWFEGEERVPRDAKDRGREYNASNCCKSDALSV